MLTYLVLAIFWTALIYATLSRGTLIIYLFFSSFAFGSLAMVPTQLIGGITFLPGPFAALGLLVWVLRKRGVSANLLSIAVSPRGMLGLLLFTFAAVASAVFLPRIFAGQVYIVPVRASDAGLHLLRPSAQNLTQAAYIIISFLTAIAVFAAVRLSPRSIYSAMLVGGIVFIATGILDALFGNSSLLDPFRTASYALNTHHSIGGMERIVGLTPEASSFGTACMTMAGLLHFLRPGMELSRRQKGLVYCTTLGLLGMAIASASSTAIVMLGVFCLLAVISGFYSFVIKKRAIGRKRVTAGLVIGAFSTAAAIFIVAFMPELIGPAFDIFEELILNKTTSKSFEGRSSWNSSAWAAFKDTYGLGVGLGGARTSSWPIAVLSNTGVFGAAFLTFFLIQIFAFHRNVSDARLQRAVNGAKLVLLLEFAGLTLSATQADFGLVSASVVGIIIAWSDSLYAATPGRSGKAASARSQVPVAWANI
ncbi:MAG: hypothetical protein ACRBEQ_12370 [Hyphomonas sp.]